MRKSIILAAALAAFTGTAQAQEFPPGPVDYVIPFGPGGESDVTARMQQPYFKALYDEELLDEDILVSPSTLIVGMHTDQV